MFATKGKSKTEEALRWERAAYQERLDKSPPALLPLFKRQAAEARSLARAPDIGVGGEVVKEQTPLPGARRAYVRDTLTQAPDMVAEEASIHRSDLLLQPSFNAVALGVDAAESIGASNSLEKMLAHQAGVAHEMALRFADRALSYELGKNNGFGRKVEDQADACRCANTAARLMGAFQGAMLTLQKLRTGGNQTVTVQHVNIQPGAQAVIGNVQPGGGSGRGNSGR